MAQLITSERHPLTTAAYNRVATGETTDMNMCLAVREAIEKMGDLKSMCRQLLDLTVHPLFEGAKLKLVDNNGQHVEGAPSLDSPGGSVRRAIGVMCMDSAVSDEKLVGVLSAHSSFVAPIVWLDPLSERYSLAHQLTVYELGSN